MKYAMCPKCGRRLCKGENGTKVEMECPKCGEFASVMPVPASMNDIVTEIDLREYVGKVAYETQFSCLVEKDREYRLRITLKQERIDRVTDKRKRKAVASMLKIDLDESGDFIIDSKEKASYLIKYLCYKIFKDGETKDILEASTISTLSIS